MDRRTFIYTGSLALVAGLGTFGKAASVTSPMSPHFSDLIEIEQLLYRYSHRIDRGTAGQVAELFAADAVFDPAYEGPGREVRGREAITAWFQKYQENSRRKSWASRHLTLNPLIALVDGEFRATSYLCASGVNRETGVAQAYKGRYEDRFVQEDGVWRFAKRRVALTFTMPLTRGPAEFSAKSVPSPGVITGPASP